MKFTLTNRNKCNDLEVGKQKETILISELDGYLIVQSECGEVLASLELDAMENSEGGCMPGSYILGFKVINKNGVSTNYAGTNFFKKA